MNEEQQSPYAEWAEKLFDDLFGYDNEGCKQLIARRVASLVQREVAEETRERLLAMNERHEHWLQFPPDFAGYEALTSQMQELSAALPGLEAKFSWQIRSFVLAPVQKNEYSSKGAGVMEDTPTRGEKERAEKRQKMLADLRELGYVTPLPDYAARLILMKAEYEKQKEGDEPA